MPSKDIREFIALLEKKGHLQRISQEVDWNLEAGAISRRGCELKLPAILFEKLKDYPPGYRLLANPLATFSRLSLAMGLPEDTPYTELVEQYLHRSTQLIKPIQVKDGPCKEEIYKAEEVNLLKFPVPLIHEGDGGRYLGTWHLVVTKDPDSGWVNWGMYRQMVLDKTSLGGIFVPFQHGPMQYYQKYEARSKPMPFATCIGVDPLSTLAACNPVEYGVNEVEVAGGLRGEPIELVQCETVDLLVPAHSEIVIEGEVLPKERREEGPFGEYTGYMAGGRAPRPVYRVKAITHRKDPILTMSNMGVPIDDCDISNSIGFGARLTGELRRKGVPIRGTVCMIPQCSLFVAVVSVKVPYAGIAHQIASTIWADKAGVFTPYVVVCDEDVDPSNVDEVLHAIATKCHPTRGIMTFPQSTGNPLNPFSDLHERTYAKAPKCLLDCTWPVDWPKEAIPKKVSFETIYPEEIKERVLSNWFQYGFKKE